MPPLWSAQCCLDPDPPKDAAIEELQKQINDIVEELNHLKERQALQTGRTEVGKQNVHFNVM